MEGGGCATLSDMYAAQPAGEEAVFVTDASSNKLAIGAAPTGFWLVSTPTASAWGQGGVLLGLVRERRMYALRLYVYIRSGDIFFLRAKKGCPRYGTRAPPVP